MAASPADEPAPWESVITRPDPMTAEERAAWLECELDEGPDPDEVQYEDDFWYPGTDLTEAELADPAGVARVLAGESSSAAAGFGTGMRLDVMPTCPDLAVLADRAAGDDDSYQGASGDELAGVLCAWDRLQAHMAARKLAAVAELARRRPVLDPPSSGRPAGTGPDDFAADELAHMLAESRRQAAGLMTVAGRLDARLPGTRAALRDGVPPAPARSAADQPPAATMSIMFRSRQAAGPACVMAARCANDNHTGCPRVYRAEPHTCS